MPSPKPRDRQAKGTADPEPAMFNAQVIREIIPNVIQVPQDARIVVDASFVDVDERALPRASIELYKLIVPDPIARLAGAWTASNLPAQDIVRILEIANDAFDDGDKATRWLQEPNIQTGNRPPISLIGTPEGFVIVESVLRQIQYGVFG